MARYKFLSFLIVLMAFSVMVSAQSDCPVIVKAALAAVDTACAGTQRNQACYGNVQLTAIPRGEMADFVFEQAGDIVDVASIESMQLSSMSLADETWGVALMQLQANLPETLPGQNVTFLLFGDVEVTNAVRDAPEITLTATGNVNVRLRPTTNVNNVMSSLQSGQEVTATGRLEDSSWVQIKVPEDVRGVGWVSAQFLRGDVAGLAVVEPGEPALGPMQAFYFKTGIGDRPCAEAPDSGILIQTPQGSRDVNLTVNGVDVTLGSTAYFQAGGGFMTVNLVDGSGTLRSAGKSQVVPAGTAGRVPLGADGLASGPPELPEPYDNDALAALPLDVAVFEPVEITPALTEAEIDRALQAAQIPGTAGSWAITQSVTLDTCPDTEGSTRPETKTITFNADGTMNMDTRVFVRAGDNVYTSELRGTNNENRPFVAVYTITFTSRTTFTAEAFLTFTDVNCQLGWSIAGTLVSS